MQTDNARQGETSGHMRWVLGVSLTLIVVAFGAIYVMTTMYAPHS